MVVPVACPSGEEVTPFQAEVATPFQVEEADPFQEEEPCMEQEAFLAEVEGPSVEAS